MSVGRRPRYETHLSLAPPATPADLDGHWRRQKGISRLARHATVGSDALMRRDYEPVLKCTDAIACINTLEQGKPIADARNEGYLANTFLEGDADEAQAASRPSDRAFRGLLVFSAISDGTKS